MAYIEWMLAEGVVSDTSDWKARRALDQISLFFLFSILKIGFSLITALSFLF
jgi:hypothetical protein